MNPPHSRPSASFVAAVTFASGAASLIFEVVWMRMLIRVFGITLYATSTIVAVYMGGLAVGAWLYGKLSGRLRPTWKLYGALEGSIGFSALAATELLKKLPWLYATLLATLWPSSPWLAQITLRIGLSILAIGLPTLLIGSTLPLLAELITPRTEEAGARLAFLYGINTFGAVAGVLSAGFALLEIFGETRTVLIAMGLNVVIFVGLWVREPEGEAPHRGADPREAARPPTSGFVLIAAAMLCGFCALAMEILWTRFLILLFGTSVYAFSLMLAAYLAGIGLGSLLVHPFVNRARKPLNWICLVLSAAAIAGISSLRIFKTLGMSASGIQFLYSPFLETADVIRLVWMGTAIILPVTLAFGALFPLFGRLFAERSRRVGESIGSLYAWNTLGGILGSLVATYVFIPRIGIQAGFVMACVLLYMTGVLLMSSARPFDKPLAITLVLAGIIFQSLAPADTNMNLTILANRLVRIHAKTFLFNQESAAATVTGCEMSDGEKILLINGIVVSGTGPAGFLMAYFPLLIHPHPRQALIVCFGTGNTFRSALRQAYRVDAVELVGDVVEKNAVFYGDFTQLRQKPGVRIFINDGRNYMLTSGDHYDVIIVDASPPIFSEGTVNLYSREFLTLCRLRLTGDGIMSLWVPTPCFSRDFWMIARTFSDVFPHVRAWTWNKAPGVLLMGSERPINWSKDMFARRIRERGLQTTAFPWLTPELAQTGWSLSEDEIKSYSRRFEPVTDDRPTTEFPLGRLLAGDHFLSTGDVIIRPAPPPGSLKDRSQPGGGFGESLR